MATLAPAFSERLGDGEADAEAAAGNQGLAAVHGETHLASPGVCL